MKEELLPEQGLMMLAIAAIEFYGSGGGQGVVAIVEAVVLGGRLR